MSALRPPTRLLAVALAAALAIAGCAGDEREASATPAGIDPMTGASTQPVRVPATNRRTALLTAIRAARHEGYDRIVFQFARAIPGYRVRYVKRPVREDGSGRRVPVKGGFVLRVRIDNASGADLTQESAPATYTGPLRFDPHTPEVAELVRAGDFEGVLTWVAGLRDRVDFRVTTLKAPHRLVVDVRNH
jgi:hypothetical protein